MCSSGKQEEYVGSKSQICMGKIYTKKLFVVYAKFKFNWVPCVILLNLPTLERRGAPCISSQQPFGLCCPS